MIDQHLGMRISKARKQLGLSIEELAGRIDVSSQHLNDIERGDVRIGAVSVARLARALDVSPRWFYHGLPGQDAFDRAG